MQKILSPFLAHLLSDPGTSTPSSLAILPAKYFLMHRGKERDGLIEASASTGER